MITWMFDNPEIGWVVVMLYLMWEIRGPKGKIAELTAMLKNVTTVVRGIARADERIDTEAVDEYLVENGAEPSDFLNDNEVDLPMSGVIDDDDDGREVKSD